MIDATARVSGSARLGKNVQIGPYTIVHDNVIIGDDTVIEAHCLIGHPARGAAMGKSLEIAHSSLVRSHSVLYEGSVFGPELSVGHSCMLREGIVAGENLQVGSFNDLEGDCEIGDYVRFHSNVHIGRGSKIGHFVWIFPYVVLTNDPLPPSGLKVGVTVGDAGVICTSSVVLPGTQLGRGVFVAAMTRAKGKIPAAAVVVGFDSQIIGSLKKLKHRETGKQHPWMSHFKDYYPPGTHSRIEELHKNLELDSARLDTELLEGKLK